jgi:serine protease Do
MFLRAAEMAIGVMLLLIGASQLTADDNSSSAALDAAPDIDAEVLQAQRERAEVIRRASEATISIFGLDGGGGGSGVVITPDGYALTNYHVSSACGDHMRCGMDDGRIYDAVIVGIDATGDVSLIKLLGRDDFPTAPLADSDQVRVGQWCFAAGNPFVLATNLQPSISYGLISGVHRYQYPANTILEYADCIQTDAAINPGNSGGPLFNLAGEVIGINGRCSFEKRNRINVGVGYAISSNQLKYFLGMLRSGRLVDHATLGATVATDSSGRAMVSNLLSDSDAYRRGLRYGDSVVGLADREVDTANTFKNILGTLPKDWRVPLTIRRDGERMTLLVRLDGVHSERALIENVSIEQPHPLERRKDSESEVPDDGQPQAPDGSGDEDSSDASADADEAKSGPAEPLQPDKQAVAERLEHRPGFANYHFNRVERGRTWQRVVDAVGDFQPTSDTWRISGNLGGESTQVSVLISPETGSLTLGSRKLEAEFNDRSASISDIVSQRRETGLLVALRAWQDLLLNGPEKIGDTVYLGQLPVYASTSKRLSEQPRCDVLESQWYDAKVRFSVEPHNGEVVLIEVFGDSGEDPVEVYLSDYQPLDAAVVTDQDGSTIGLKFPQLIRLQYGTEPVVLLQVSQVQVDVDESDDSEASDDE